MTGPRTRPPGPAPPPLERRRGEWRFPAALAVSIVLAVGTSLAVTAVWRSLQPDPSQDVHDVRTGLARLARSTLLLAFAALYWFLLRRSRPPFLEAAGFAPARGAVRSYVLGFVAGVVPVVALIAILVLAGARTFEPRASAGKIAWLATKFVLLGIPLVVLEEGLFRGLLLGDLVRACGTRLAVVLGSAFFACTHFLGASESWKAAPEAPTAASAVLANFAGLERMFREWPELVGLFLVGTILSVVRLRSGALWLGMGIHAGWYWVRSIDRWFVRDVDAVITENRLWLGTSQYHDGAVGWLALLATLLFALTIRLPWSRSADPVRAS